MKSRLTEDFADLNCASVLASPAKLKRQLCLSALHSWARRYCSPPFLIHALLFVVCSLCYAESSRGLAQRWEHVYNEVNPTGGRLGYHALVRSDLDGNTATIMMSDNLQDGQDIIVIKRQRTTGKVLWEKRLSSPGKAADYAHDATFDSRGDLYLTGIWANSYDDGVRISDFVTARLSGATGDVIWLKTFDHSATRRHTGSKIRVLSSGEIEVLGSHSPNSDSSTNSTMIFLKYSSEGELLREFQLPVGNAVSLTFCGENHVVAYSNQRVLKIHVPSASLEWERLITNTFVTADEETGLICKSHTTSHQGDRHRITCLSPVDGAERWTRLFDSDIFLGAWVFDGAQGLILTGGVKKNEKYFGWFERCDVSNGSVTWRHELSSEVIFSHIKAAGDGGWVAAGELQFNGFTRPYIAKVSDAGKRVYVAQAPSPNSSSVTVDLTVGTDGEATLIGYSIPNGETFPIPPESYISAAFSSRGAALWRNNWLGGTSMVSEYAVDVKFDTMGNIVTAGHSHPLLYVDVQQIVIMKLDAKSGTRLWTAKYDGPGKRDSWCQGLAVDRRDDVLVCVSATTSTDINKNDTDVIVLKYSGDDGKLLWSKRLGLPYGIKGVMSLTPAGDVIVSASHARVGTQPEGSYLYLLSGANGSIRWRQQMYSTPYSGFTRSILVAQNGMIFVRFATSKSHITNATFEALYALSELTGEILWSFMEQDSTVNGIKKVGLATDQRGRIFSMSYVYQGNTLSDVRISALEESDGRILWQKLITQSSSSAFAGTSYMRVTESGDLIVFTQSESARLITVFQGSDGVTLRSRRNDSVLPAGSIVDAVIDEYGGISCGLYNGWQISALHLSIEDGSLLSTHPLGLSGNDNKIYHDLGPSCLAASDKGEIAVAYTRNFDIGVSFFTQQEPALPVLTQSTCVEITPQTGKDFGGLLIGESRSLVFQLKNAGDADLKLLGSTPGHLHIEGSEAFRIVAQPAIPVLVSGAVAEFSVVFEPEGEGLAEAELIIETDGAMENRRVFPLRGMGYARNSLAFDRSVWRMGSNDRFVDVTVRRLEADAEAAVSVVARSREASVLPSFEAAKPGQHFIVPTQEERRLNFAAGEKEKVMRLNLPAQPTGNQQARHFELVLEDAENATLGVISTAVVEVLPPDKARTAIQILSPGARVLGLVPIQMEGIIQDVGGLRAVEVQLNESCPILPTVSSGSRAGSWVFSTVLRPRDGQNTVEVRTEDIHGNMTVLRREFTFSPMYALPVGASSAEGGAVSISRRGGPALRKVPGGAEVSAGTVLELKATARPGQWFSHWTGLPSSADEEHDQVRLKINHGDLSAITAVFVPSPLAGQGALVEFRGLIQPTNKDPWEARHVGILSATVTTSTGAMTGKIEHGGRTNSFVGALRGDGSLWFKQKGSTSRFARIGVLTLTGVLEEAQLNFKGVMEPNDALECAAFAAKYNRQKLTPEGLQGPRGSAGRFNALYSVSDPGAASSYPMGSSIASIQLSKFGRVTVSIVLSDETSITASSTITDTDRLDLCSFFKVRGAAKSNNLGCFMGSMMFDESGLLGGQMRWFKPPLMRTRPTASLMYEDSWPYGMFLNCVGSSYRPANTFERALNFSEGVYSYIRFDEGGLDQSLVFKSLIQGNLILLYDGRPRQLTLVLDPARGIISGSVAPDPWKLTERAKFRSVITDFGADGFFINPHGTESNPQSGVFKIYQ